MTTEQEKACAEAFAAWLQLHHPEHAAFKLTASYQNLKLRDRQLVDELIHMRIGFEGAWQAIEPKQRAEEALLLGYSGCIGLLCELSTQLRHNGEDEDNRDNIEQAVSDWCALTGWTYRRILHRIEVLPPDPPPLTAEL